MLISTRADTGSLYKDLKTAADKLYDRSLVLDGEGSKSDGSMKLNTIKMMVLSHCYFSPNDHSISQ